MRKRAVINVATEGYKKGQKRLLESLGRFSKGSEHFSWDSPNLIGAPDHNKNPYAFKVYAFKKMLEAGYRQILWLDASVYAIKDIEPVWQIIENEGYLMQYSGWKAGQWTNDAALEYFNITRDQAMEIPMYGNAGLLGLNFDFQIANEFLTMWDNAQASGVFIGQWNNNTKSESQDIRCLGHRHDMCCGSIIAHKLGMKYKDATTILQYASPEEKPHNDQVYFFAQGIN